MSPVAFLGSLAFKVLVVRLGARSLSRVDNPKRDNVTWWSATSVVFLLVTLDLVAGILGAIFPFALPLYWVALAVTHLLVFAAYYGLAPWRWLWMFPILAIGDHIWLLVIRLIGL